MPLPLPSALLHLPFRLGSLFFPSRTPLTDTVSGTLARQMGGETVLQACRVVAGCRWVTADAQEPCCGVAVDARGSKSDSLPRAR